MKKLIATVGIQASGKSTWAMNWAKESPTTRVRFNNDDIRNMLGVYWVPSREDLISSVKNTLINEAMENNYNIVVDNMNLNPKEQHYLENVVLVHNAKVDEGLTKSDKYELEYKYFFTPLEECIERDKKRENPIGESVIKNTYRKYKTQIAKFRNIEYWKTRITNSPGLIDVAIIDLDGTVAYSLSGRPFYGPGCAEGIPNDIADTSMVKLIKALNKSGIEIIFITGRDESVYNETEKWIKDNITDNFKLLMRDKGDYRNSSECKSSLYDEYIKDRYNVIVVIDDDNSEMWINKGVLYLNPMKL